MKKLIKILSAIILCLSAYVFTSCSDAEFIVAYEPTPVVYHYPYSYRYYVPPRRVYVRPTPPPPRRPVVAPKPKPRTIFFTNQCL